MNLSITQEISYPLGTLAPRDATALPVISGIEWLRLPLPFALNHVNVWLLPDSDDDVGETDIKADGASAPVSDRPSAAGWCAIDTGVTWDKSERIWDAWLAEHRLTRVLVTHYHPDHVGMAGWLQQKTGAPLWMTHGEYVTAHALWTGCGNYNMAATAALFRRHGMTGRLVAEIDRLGNLYRDCVPVIPPTYRRLFDNQIVRIGPYRWCVIIGYGHAMEHISLYAEEAGVLIAGDMLLPAISTNISVRPASPLGNPLRDFLASIQRFVDLPDDTLVLPSHGRPFRGIRARVNALLAHHEARLAALVAAARQPVTAAALLPVLFERPIDDTNAALFAMSECIAHLNYLEAAGKLRRAVDPGDGGISFVAL